MAKLTLSDLSSIVGAETSAIGLINANNALIETALENTLSRDGTSPNTMSANLDMNSNRITNLPAPSDDNEPARKADISSAVLVDNSVTLAKFQDIDSDSILGRDTAGTGDPEVLSASAVRTILNVADGANNYSHPNHSGDVTSTGDGATVIANDSVTLAKMADMATDSFIGRDTSGTGDPEVLSAATARTILNVADGANNYVHPNHTGDVTSVADGTTTIAANAVTESKIANLNITTAKLGESSVTNEKLQNVNSNTIKGRFSASTGEVEDITPDLLTEQTTPATGNFLLGWDGNLSTSNIRKFDVGDLPTPSTATTTTEGIVELATSSEIHNPFATGKILENNSFWTAHDYTTLTDAASITFNPTTGLNFEVTLGGNRTLANPSADPGIGRSGFIIVDQDGTGSRTLSFGSSYVFAGGTAPTLSTAANARDVLQFVFLGGLTTLITVVALNVS